MNKQELIKAAAVKSGMQQPEIEKALNAIMESITESVLREEPVTLVGFGTFLVKERAARQGYNPATGGTMEIPAKKQVKFRPGKNMEVK